MNKLSISFLFCFAAFFSYAQKIQVQLLQSEYHADSSYYHLAKIGDNEYWACGESGVLTSFDTIGNIKKLPISLQGKNILKAERSGNTVFIATDDASIFKFHLQDSILQKIDLKGFKSKCFYDFQIFPDGKMLLCGGSTGISRALKKIPRGFILLTDTSLQQTDRVWRSFRKFVWSICCSEDGYCYAASFNGINTKILASSDLLHWKKHSKVSGLVHDLKMFDKKLYYAGGTSFHFNRPGMLGIDKTTAPRKMTETGCIWGMEASGDAILACTQSGQIITLNLAQDNSSRVFSGAPAIYDFKLLSPRRILAVGHGRYAAVLKF